MNINHRLLTLIAASVVWAAVAVAQPRLHYLNICVELMPDGSALVSEMRQMTIDDTGTEVYISMPNMHGGKVGDLRVVDESGRQFENIGEWKTDRDREQKTGKCGIVHLDDGYELCWGQGQTGERTYFTTYRLDGLVRSYPDADGICHVFLPRGGKPKPEHARLTILMADGRPIIHVPDSLEQADTGGAVRASAWAFGLHGELLFEDRGIMVETSEPMEAESAIYLLARFPKGCFLPAMPKEGLTFEEERKMAFEDSDYFEPQREQTLWKRIMALPVELLAMMGLLLVIGIGGTWSWVKEKLRFSRIRRRVYKDLPWYRDIPLGGNLVSAHSLLVSLGEAKPQTNNVLLAAVLRLVSTGALSIVRTDSEEERIRVADEMPDGIRHHKWQVRLYELFKKAAGDDSVLDPGELKHYLVCDADKETASDAAALIRSLTNIGGNLFGKPRKSRKKNPKKVRREKRQQEEAMNRNIADARQVVGLRKMLKEFTLLDERHAREVTLWREYMVWATLFGIADQVKDDMKKINPDYFRMDSIASQLLAPVFSTTVVTSLNEASTNIHERFEREASSRWTKDRMENGDRDSYERTRYEGGGGHTSWGGGGRSFSGHDGSSGVR